jgi:hypothetical protein
LIGEASEVSRIQLDWTAKYSVITMRVIGIMAISYWPKTFDPSQLNDQF